jgi:hypothetical protein
MVGSPYKAEATVAEEEESITLGVLKNAVSGVLASWPCSRIPPYAPHVQQWLPIREAPGNSQPCWTSLFEYFILSLVLVSMTHMLMKRANIWNVQQPHIGINVGDSFEELWRP